MAIQIRPLFHREEDRDASACLCGELKLHIRTDTRYRIGVRRLGSPAHIQFALREQCRVDDINEEILDLSLETFGCGLPGHA